MASVQGNQVEVKTTDGKVVTVVFDAKTAVTRGKTKLDAAALKVGERVSVDYTQAKERQHGEDDQAGRGAAPPKK